MILIDPPRWPAHGTLFSHLVSDASLAELHGFGRAAGIPPQAYDHDHYDVPAKRYADLVAAGARAVDSRELLRRLRAGGLRVRPRDKTPTRSHAAAFVRHRWDADPPAPASVRDALLRRWREPHRHYHDVRHLAHTLAALDNLGTADSLVVLAAWFHDAVHEGVAGDDERASADLAGRLLRGHLPPADVAEVQRLVLVTTDHDPAPGDERGRTLSDADLSVLGLPAARYHVYARDVRLEYAHVAEGDFVAGRSAVLEHLLELASVFRTPAAAGWEASARDNLTAELAHLRERGTPLVG